MFFQNLGLEEADLSDYFALNGKGHRESFEFFVLQSHYHFDHGGIVSSRGLSFKLHGSLKKV